MHIFFVNYRIFDYTICERFPNTFKEYFNTWSCTGNSCTLFNMSPVAIVAKVTVQRYCSRKD